jgi:hypothetical protein
MADWFERTLVDTGRLPLFCFFAGVILGFAGIRFSVRMIRAEVKWWPGNVSSGGVHIHHVVFGVVLMLVAGVAALAIPDDLTGWRAGMAGLFGVGSALVLDEFALILHLDDVYWSEKGRTSVDAVFVAIAFTGLLLFGVQPVAVKDLVVAGGAGGGLANWVIGTAFALINLGVAAITLLKGKIWTGLLGLFLPILIYVGAVRLARPQSPWARWRYRRSGGRAAARLARSERREERIHGPMTRARIRIEDFVAGRHDSATPV